MTTLSLLSTVLLAAAQAGPGVGLYPPVPPGERLVGIAYSTWFPPVNWGSIWGTPELGEYRSDDPAVLRQHAEWLAYAGVDFVWIDWSNNWTHDPGLEGKAPVLKENGERFLAYRPDIAAIETATDRLFEVFATVPDAPKVSIFLGYQEDVEGIHDGRLRKKFDQVYRDYVQHPTYGPMLQTYLGKPLVVVYLGTPCRFRSGVPDWDDDRFTVRWMTGFITEQHNLRDADTLLSKYGYWSWEERGDQTFPVHDGRPESMNIVASWRMQAEPGQPGYIAPGLRRDGDTFRERWARARAIGPRFAMVVSWNEWTTGEQPSVENSKDIEPSVEFGHQYLDLLKEEIARFKGTD